eukprot:364493-Chlamydomonas_euryale.AAC.1
MPPRPPSRQLCGSKAWSPCPPVRLPSWRPSSNHETRRATPLCRAPLAREREEMPPLSTVSLPICASNLCQQLVWPAPAGLHVTSELAAGGGAVVNVEAELWAPRRVASLGTLRVEIPELAVSHAQDVVLAPLLNGGDGGGATAP